jgi:DNA polymerase III subunit gamma/tau
MLSSSAFNAFLKTLEEPPPYAIFILATTEKHKILPTILSRCQIFDFKRITNNDTVTHLQEICGKEGIKADKAALHIIAQKSEGCMRDSLSILDKIVSFTNGELTYANTLEHLNILDEDYYFKMLDCMQQEDLPGSMLLFDDINRKGFEGDLVLNGFAEFIRNLLVSRDTRAAILLEVADDFKQKYMQAAQKVHAAWMIAALNVLNDAEINYKQARNKRLHVELVLIKLSYLAQAIELVNAENGISKKKIAEGEKVLAFRALPVIEVKGENGGSTAVVNNGGGAKLIIEQEKPVSITQPAPVTKQPAAVAVQAEPAPPRPAIGSLQKLRQKIVQQNKDEAPAKDLTTASLQEAWRAFTDQLKSTSNHSAASNFKDAVLKITSTASIEIFTPNIISQKFIDAERAGLTAHLQGWFNNRALTYQVIVEERTEMPQEPQEKSLNTKEQYLKLIEEYPMVKELRDKLRLELDY